MAQYAKHYEQKSDSSNAHTLNSSSAIIEQHTMSNLASLDLYAPVRNITSSRDIHPIYFMTKIKTSFFITPFN